MIRGSILLFALLAASPALAAEPAPREWIVMPVWGENAPPADPSYLRLTAELSVAIERVAGSAPVRVVTREKRQDVCADQGHLCPNEVASLIEADKVVELEINAKMDKLIARLWGRPRGLLRQVEVSCTWGDGRPVCPIDAFESGLKGADSGIGELDPKVIEEAFKALEPKIKACQEKPSHKGKAKNEVEVTLAFRVTPSGRVREVRVDPRELQNLPAWACAARTVEALRVPPFKGDQAVPFRFPIGRALVVHAPPSESPPDKN